MGEAVIKKNNHLDHTRPGGRNFFNLSLKVNNLFICATSVRVLLVQLRENENLSFIGFSEQIGILLCCIFLNLYMDGKAVWLCLCRRLRLKDFSETEYIRGGRMLYV